MRTNELIEQLTGPGSGDIEALVCAARARASRRHTLRDTGTAALILVCAAGALGLLLRPQSRPAPAVARETPPPPALTGDELLDSFGDQPVALVTYPDGSQRLLAILRP